MLVGNRAARLSNDVPVPARVIVQVDDALGASVQAGLDERVVLGEVLGIEVDAQPVVGQVLPPDRQTEDVKSEVPREVLHLAGAVGAAVLRQWRVELAEVAAAIGGAGEVEAG